jgi:hypothetical protein
LKRHRVAEATKAATYFRANGAILKGNALLALSSFSEGALRVLEYVGGNEHDSLVLGNFAMGRDQRRGIGCIVNGAGVVARLPGHGMDEFVSFFQKPERAAAVAAFMD